MRKFWSALILSVGMVSLNSFAGTTYTVDDDGPADFSSVQDAIDFASDGDVVEVQPGEYSNPASINFQGRAITVKGTDPNDDAVIEATWIRASIRFDNGEDNSSVLLGLKIGIIGTIECNFSSPQISHCVVVDRILGNTAQPLIKNCKFISDSGVEKCDGIIDSCHFTNVSGNNLNPVNM